jgi:hypothetical protein
MSSAPSGCGPLICLVMDIEPVTCACGRPVNGAEDNDVSTRFGPMCDSCIRLLSDEAGRLCDRCIRRVRAMERPGVRFGVSNKHPLAHSRVLDTCVDRAILPFLEGFNRNVASTFSSCQGIDMLPGRPDRWIQEPFIVIRGKHQAAVTAWAEQGADRYRISAVRVLGEGSPYHRVMVDFADTPVAWLG